MSAQTSSPRRRRHPVWRWMFLFLFTTLAASFVLQKMVVRVGDSIIAHLNTADEIFIGVITDSQCGAEAMQGSMEACIERCVQSDAKTKFALYDGHGVYVLSDQETPRKFAARKVRIRGTLRKDKNILDVITINPA